MFGLDSIQGKIHLICFQTIVFMVFLCHAYASWMDPGLVPRDTTNGAYFVEFERRMERALKKERAGNAHVVNDLRRTFCRKCKVPKPKGTHHCSTCQRCVRQMDHHCPWVNSCVGERNLKAFFLFLCYVTVGTGYAVIMMITRTYQVLIEPALTRQQLMMRSRNQQLAILGCCVVALIMALFFFAFVMCMFYDQYESFVTGVPGVDAMQMHEDDLIKKQSCYRGFKDMIVHNEPFSWRWFFPIPARDVRKRPSPPPPEEEAQEAQDVQQAQEAQDVQQAHENDGKVEQHEYPPDKNDRLKAE